jgi:hypothetical protein
MFSFAEEVLVEESLYVDVSALDTFRSKFDISATGREKDVVLLSCDPDERVCNQEMGEGDESYFMYTAVLEEFGVKIPFTPFEMDAFRGIWLFPQYACNFKEEWRDTFVRVQGAIGCSTTSVLVAGQPKFP